MAMIPEKEDLGIVFLPTSKVAEKVGRTRQALYVLRQTDPTFPKPITMSEGRQARLYWVKQEVEAWQDRQMARRG
jgi:predicted DNA-binding transcriptional regulator AlpA